MTQSTNQKGGQTIGLVTADVHSPNSIPPYFKFKSGAEVSMYRDNENINIFVIERFSSGHLESHSIYIEVPDMLPGGQATYDLSNSTDVRARYAATRGGVYKTFRFEEGTLSVALDPIDTLNGNFQGVAYWNEEHAVFTFGQISLKGFITPDSAFGYQGAALLGTGTMHGSVGGGPFPHPSFTATDVELKYWPETSLPENKARWTITGQWKNASFPHAVNSIAIKLDADQTGSSFDLSPNDKVYVSYLNWSNSYYDQSSSGMLNFVTRPETGTAEGTVDCTLSGAGYPDFSVKFTFKIS
ncbi:hypothetical protein [Pseudomonas sp. AF03-9]|uniref:hypothetical protein n=1 Tax=Pseudomonas sp. AF03-9 TaxID=2849867 RepID=UPI001CF980FC|nr:hypothetical protein [Pseudomonas sp. AF03-9]